jgi:hypothetical protein
MSDAMCDGVKKVDPRPLTDREIGWISEIVKTRPEWSSADISRTEVIAEGASDDGISALLQAPEPEEPKLAGDRGYIGRIWITNLDDSIIEVRLTHINGRLNELFVLFVDPKHPHRVLPERWTEVSHEAFAL